MANRTPDDRPNLDEQYANAVTNGSLTVKLDRRTPADTIIASGWSRSRLGGALMRLLTEYDAAAKPKPPHARAVELLAKTMAGKDGQPDRAGAKRQSREWHEHELMMFFRRLHTFPAVRDALHERARMTDMRDPRIKAAAVLEWWLDSTCPACHGRKWQEAPGTGRLLAKACDACNGTGKRPIPHADDGRHLLKQIDDALHAHRNGMRGRFQHQMRRESSPDGDS